MIEFIKKFWPPLIILLTVLVFFWQTPLKGLLPIPSDTIVGLYHPYLDMYAKISPAGIPFKNFLITDPVRQIIPWKMLVVDSISSFSLPLWNPYEMVGKPLLANFQSGVFYPFNILLFAKPFYLSWTLFIILQPILSGIFLLAYLRNLGIDNRASLFGVISYVFGGFSIAWLEWGNIGHTALWLPLILLSIDKIFERTKKQEPKTKNFWNLVFLFSLVSSFFAGHLQIFFYVFIISLAYLLFRWFEHGRKIQTLILFTIYYLLFTILTAVQWVPTLQFVNLSGRGLDQNPLTSEGWFIPWQHLIQFLAPDFFGNPATLNYFGVWNYAEFAGYIGAIGLFFAFFSILSKRKKEVLFFVSAIIASLVFALPTSIGKLPFDLSIPFLSSAQPTRLVFLISFSLSILSALGFDYLIEGKKINKRLIVLIGIVFAAAFSVAWLIAFGKIDLKMATDDLLVARRNLIFPSGIFALGTILILGVIFVKEAMARNLLILLILALSFYDVYRFGTKFTPFTTPDYFYPQTRVIEFLKKDKGIFRIAATDSRIFPPNFSTYYKIQSIEGYDPLYLASYAELIAASEREDHSSAPPFGFNRIITPHNMNSKTIDLLGVKYVLSLSELNSAKLSKVFQEGQTRVYENRNVSPRAFFVDQVINASNKKDIILGMFSQDLTRVAYVEKNETGKNNFTVGNIRIVDYDMNKIKMESQNSGDGFLVLTDSFYPTWKAKIDGSSSKVYKTDHTFRGIFVPKGSHEIIFYNTLF